MNKLRTAVLFLSIALTFSFPLFCHPYFIPSVNRQIPENEVLDSVEIIETALEFSLCPLESPEGQNCLKKYAAIEKQVLKRFSEHDKETAAEELLAYLYDSILFNYVEHSTRLNTTLMTGEYNCVTASVLYLALSHALGIDSRGQECTIHAFVSVYLDGRKIDVETTNPYGFNPGVKKIVENSDNLKKYSWVTKKYYAGKREISDRAFATLTGKNLAADLNDTDAYDEAIPLDLSRYIFLEGDPEKKTARGDLDILVTNYALTLSKKQRQQEALEFLNEYIELTGQSDLVGQIYDNTVYNGAVNFVNEDMYSEARAFTAEYGIYTGPVMKTRIEKMINTRYLKQREVSVHNQIVPLYNEGKFEEARIILQEGLKENPASSTLKRDLQLVERALK